MATFFTVTDGVGLSWHSAPTEAQAREYVARNLELGEAMTIAPVQAVYPGGQRFDVMDLPLDEPFEPAHALVIPPIGKESGECHSDPANPLTREQAFEECARRNQERLEGHLENGPEWSIVLECGDPAPVRVLNQWRLNGREGVEEFTVTRPIRVVEPTAAEVERYATVPVEV